MVERLWQFLRPSSVRVRITLAATLVTAVAVGTAGWLLVRLVEDKQEGDLRASAEAEIDVLATNLAEGADPDAVLGEVPPGMVVNLENEDGVVVARQRPAPYAPAEAGVDPPEKDQTISGPNGDSQRPAMQIVERKVSTPSGEVRVLAAQPLDQVNRSVDAVRQSLYMGFPFVVGLAALAAWWLAGRALRPVESIRVQAEAIGGSTLHRRVPESRSGDEIGRLARTMNAMLGRLDDSARRQRQFVSDASHELRSPVAAIRTDLEVALHEGDQADWPSVARAVLAEEARLEALLGDLFVLAAEDEKTGEAPDTRVDVAAIVADESARSRRVPVSLDVRVDESPTVAGHRGQLQRAVRNLVDNAARHAQRKVRIVLSLQDAGRSDERVRIDVDDDGPGIAKQDRERIFERFTRLDDGRARDEGGAGLGLAVVESIVIRHHGQIRVSDSPLGGARFTVLLPPHAPN